MYISGITLSCDGCDVNMLQMAWKAPIATKSQYVTNELQMGSKWAQKLARKLAPNVPMATDVPMATKVPMATMFQWQQSSNGNKVLMATKVPMAT